MSMNSLVVYEKALEPALPAFGDLLQHTSITPERLVRTVMISLEKTPKLREATAQSVVNAAMSAAVLGLEVDGVTGQGFLVPFKIKGTPMAQFLIGYRGYNTLAFRNGFTINAGLIREGDDYEYQEGTGGFIRVKRKLGNESNRTILASWALASSLSAPEAIALVPAEELHNIASKAKSGGSGFSPWQDPKVGFPAMCEKTARRRLSRSLPLVGFARANALETQVEELGKMSYFRPDGALISEGSVAVQPVEDASAAMIEQAVQKPSFTIILADGTDRQFETIVEWRGLWERLIEKFAQNKDGALEKYRSLNGTVMAEIAKEHFDDVMAIQDSISKLLKEPAQMEPWSQQEAEM